MTADFQSRQIITLPWLAPVDEFVQAHPQGSRVAEKPEREQNAEGRQRPEQHLRRDIGEELADEIGGRDDERRGAVIEVDRAQEVARLAVENQPATATRLRHPKPAAKQLPLATARAAQAQRAKKNCP